MSADNSTEWLIDSLYPEERDDDASYELTPEDHVQRLEMEQLLGSMREHLPVASPSPEVRALLLKTAQSALIQEVEQQAQSAPPSAPRAANATRSPSTSAWQRSKVHALAQIAGVAVVLVLGVITVAQLQNSALDKAGMTSQDLLVAKEAPAPAAAVNPADFPNKVQAEPQGDVVAQNTAKQESSQEEIALAKTPRIEPQERRVDDAPEEIVQAAKTQTPEPQAPKPKPVATSKGSGALASSPELQDGLGRGSYGGRSSAPYDREAAKKQAPLGEAAADEFVNLPPQVTKAEPAPVAKGKADAPQVNSLDASGAAEDVDGKDAVASAVQAPAKLQAPMEAKRARRSAREAAPSAAPAPSRASKGLSKPGSGVPTYDGIQRSARAERHNDTLSQADGYLRSGKGSVTQRARVMELKAQALKGLGRTDEANRVLASIRKQYPSYYKKKNLRRKKKSMKKSRSVNIENSDSLGF